MANVSRDMWGPICADCGEGNPDQSHQCKAHIDMNLADLDVAVKTLQETVDKNSDVWETLYFSVATRQTAAKRIREWVAQIMREQRLQEHKSKHTKDGT